MGALSRWFGWGGMNVLGVDVVEDAWSTGTRSLLPPCVIADPPTFGIRTLRRSVLAYMLMTHSERPVLLLSHPQVLAGGHHRRQELLPHRGCWIGDTGKGGTGFADVSCGSGLSVF